jgi:amino acid adenylation domain-containing protein
VSKENKFSCVIVGEGTLPIQCAELLLRRGHEICGAISPDPSFMKWAIERRIPSADPATTPSLVSFLKHRSFDYLFCIVNYVLLPEIMESLPCWNMPDSVSSVDQTIYDTIIQLPRCGAINYHDGPLPLYAGFYVTSWAILQHEKTHGVSWHSMTGQIDAGDIWKQRLIGIDPDETALTLNIKCYDAAIISFAELIDDLENDRVTPRHQDMSERVYFPFYERPRAGCVLSWRQDAQDIDAFVRALQFGPYPNPLGLPKLAMGKHFLIVPKLDVLDSSSNALAGTITSITDDAITISSSTRQVLLRKLLTIDGEPLPVLEAAARFGLHEGYRLEDLDQEVADRLTTNTARTSEHETFWINRLTKLRPVTLPQRASAALEHAAVREESSWYRSLPIPISAEVSALLETRYPAWNLGDFLLTTFSIYLARLSNATCFDVGLMTIELKRQLDAVETFFAEWVPLHVDLDLHWPLEKIHEVIKAEVNLVKEHYTYARDVVARYPALDTLHGLPYKQRWPVVVMHVEALDDYQAIPGAEYALVISRKLANTACLVYDSRLFHEDSVGSMVQQFMVLLRGLLTTSEERSPATLSLLTEPERHQVLVQWNDTRVEYPKEQCLHQLFEAQVERTPGATAVVFEDKELTYLELNIRANQLGHQLKALSAGPGTLIGVCIDRSLEMVVALLGILKAGGAYIPLDPAYPQERLAFMLEDARAPIVLTQGRLLENLSKYYKGHLLCVNDTEQEVTAQGSRKNLSNTATMDDLAYVIYTSGSTGKPKGVMIPHRAICNHMHWFKETFSLTETDRVLQKTPFSFDASVWEFYAPLMVGGQLIMARPGGHQDGAYLVKTIMDKKVTTLQLVPTLLRMLLAEAGLEGCRSLKRVFCGGEALPVQLQERFFDRLPTNLYNLYGPTEAAIDSTYWACERWDSRQTVPIGHPIANAQAYILDSHLQPVPIGVPGELHIGGEGLARGYLNRPELTSEKFIPDPFTMNPSARLYKTGDLARYLPDGVIEFLGRTDYQVKIHGFRIELGEIEGVLGQHSAVQQAAVLVRDDAVGGKRLVAYFVARQRTPSVRELREFLQGRLPDYMVPSVFVSLDALPLTPNGKIDRRTLPMPGLARPALESPFVAPRTPIEETLVGIWAEVLGLEQVGIHDNFLELGGNSLLATRMVSRIDGTFGVDISLSALFEKSTVAELATIITQRKAERVSDGTLEQMLAELEQLSANEAEILLSDNSVMETN